MSEASASEGNDRAAERLSWQTVPDGADVRGWASGLAFNEVDIWREVLSQLRHIYNSIWTSVRVFFTVNALLASVVGLVGHQAEYVQDGLAVGALAIIGLIVNAVALRILWQQWSEYLGVLLRKSILEDELGFSRMKVRDVDLSLPTTPAAPGGSLESLLHDPSGWYGRQRRSGGLFILLCLMYAVVIAIYLTALVMVAIGFISGYFFAKS